MEKKDGAAKDAAVAATAGVPEAEKATGARKEEGKAELKEPAELKKMEKEEKKAALFQRYSLS